jgi:hypothetical protein
VKLARALEAIDQTDEAAGVLCDVVSSPSPPPETLLELKRLLLRVSPPVRERIAQLGSTPERPIHVPAVEFEYSWVAAFACVEGLAHVTPPTVRRGPKGELHALEFSCAEGPVRSIFFDFSADPAEKRAGVANP